MTCIPAFWESRNRSVAGKLGVSVRLNPVQTPPHRFSDRQQDEKTDRHAWYAKSDEGGAPAVGLRHRSGHVGAQPRADRSPESEDGHRHRPAIGREMVGDDGVGGWRSPGLADTDPDPRQQQLQIGAGHAAQGAHDRPRHERRHQDVAAVRAVGEPRQRDAEGDVEQSEGNAGQEGDAAVSEVQFEPDRLQHRGHHIAIGDADGVDDRHHGQDIPARGRRGGSRHRLQADRRHEVPPSVMNRDRAGGQGRGGRQGQQMPFLDTSIDKMSLALVESG